jgi:hypothetical protein
MIRENGVANNWLWWSFLLTGMMTVFFYARMWRRSGVLTDLEFYEIRYSGKAASFVRGFRSIYLGLFFNCVIMATVNLAASKIASVVLGSKLLEFYRLVQPAGPGWRQIRAEAGASGSPDGLAESLLGWTLGCAFVYAALFGTGSFLYGKTAQGLFWSLILVVSLVGLSRVLPRIWSSSQG